MTEYRRILLGGAPVQVTRHGDVLRASDGREIAIEDAVHLPPTEPQKIIAVHLNYQSRTDEFMTKLPAAPTYFHKPVTALNSHGGDIVRPAGCQWLNYEGEIVIVIGKTCRNVSPEEAGDYIAGYTVGNDYGLHDFRDTDAGSMLRVKGSDTLAPVGPGLVTDWDFRNKTIRTIVNGEVKQEDSTANMEWDMHYLVADLARTITLVPGDMIFSGTPANSRPVNPGDVVEAHHVAPSDRHLHRRQRARRGFGLQAQADGHPQRACVGRADLEPHAQGADHVEHRLVRQPVPRAGQRARRDLDHGDVGRREDL